MTSAISGTRRTVRELVDGTLRVVIDVEPMHKAQFLKLFPEVDMPVAMVALKADFEYDFDSETKGPDK